MAEETPQDKLEHILVDLRWQLYTRRHLQEQHGYQGWDSERFCKEYPWLVRPDGTFDYVALHMAAILAESQPVVIILTDQELPPDTPIA